MSATIELVIIIIAIAVVSIISLIMCVINNLHIKKYTKMYEKGLAKFNSTENVKDEFQNIYDKLSEVENINKSTVEMIEKFSEQQKANVQKIGFVKYNAYDETENKLSFALALLDANNNGVLINHIYSRHGSAIYSKLVTNGVVEERISEEEAIALKQADEDKNFKIRKTAFVNKKGTKTQK